MSKKEKKVKPKKGRVASKKADVKQVKPQMGRARYRGIIFSIVVFLLLIIAILGLNLYSSFQINTNAAAIDKAGQMRDQTQSITRDLFDMRLSYGEDPKSPHISSTLKRMGTDAEQISSDFSAFERGGMVTDSDGRVNEIEALTLGNDIQLLNTAKQQWDAYRPLIDDYLATATDIRMDSTPLDLAINGAQGSSIIMYNALDSLTNNIKERAYRQAEQLRLIQIIGIVLVILYFIIFVFYFLRKLRGSDRLANEARRETEDIMQTVKEGLFLVDKDLVIGSQYSAQLSEIIGQANVAGRPLADLLASIVSQKDLETARSFIGLLFDRRKKASLIGDLNPLDQVEIQVSDRKGHFHTRYLNFNFSRVYDEKEIKKVLVGVSDITAQIELEKRLEREQANNNEQMEMLTSLLHTDMGMLDSFLKHSYRCTDKVNSILMRPDQTRVALQKKSKDIYVEVHSLKGEASALGLDSFVTITHEFEEKIKEINAKPQLSGNDFLPLAVSLEEIIDLRSRVEMLIERLGGFASAKMISDNQQDSAFSAPLNAPVFDESQAPSAPEPQVAPQPAKKATLATHFTKFAGDIARRNGKQVALQTNGLTPLEGKTEYAATLRDVTIQLLRNAIVHGVESPDVRQQTGKSAEGHISIHCTQEHGQLLLAVEDDGSGLDYEKIRRKAVQRGLVSADKAGELTSKQLVAILFSSGFSTADVENEDAGRGVGLDIIRERVKSLHGRIQVQSKPKHHTKFVVIVPAQEVANA